MRRWVIAVISLCMAMPTALGLWAFWWVERPLALASPQVEVSVEAGTTPREVAQRWVDAGVNTSPWLLYQWFRVSGQARKIRAGTYAVDASTSAKALLDKMVQGDESLDAVRIKTPFGRDASGSMLSDHVGYVATYRLRPITRSVTPTA